MKTIEINGTIYEIGRVAEIERFCVCSECCLIDICSVAQETICKLDECEYLKRPIGQSKPTKKQLIKAFQIFYSDKIDAEFVNAETDFEPIVTQILEHWEDECKKTEG